MSFFSSRHSFVCTYIRRKLKCEITRLVWCTLIFQALNINYDPHNLKRYMKNTIRKYMVNFYYHSLTCKKGCWDWFKLIPKISNMIKFDHWKHDHSRVIKKSLWNLGWTNFIMIQYSTFLCLSIRVYNFPTSFTQQEGRGHYKKHWLTTNLS